MKLIQYSSNNIGNGKMKKQKIGLILFLLGALIIFGIGWVAPWFTSPVWSSAPPEHFEETIWEAFGLIFMAMSLLTPAGMLMIAIGTLLLGDSVKSHIWPYSIGIVLVIFSWIRSGICFQIFFSRALIIEFFLTWGSAALITCFTPDSMFTWALGIWMFFLVQSLYFVILGDRSLKEKVAVDPFEEAMMQAEKIISGYM